MSTVLDQLLEMGCNPIISEAAIKQLKTQDLSTLLDWISDHSEEEEKWSKWLQEQGQGQKIEGQEQGQNISHLVKKEFVEALMGKGYSKNVAEKSLLLTGNTSIQSAENWINEHKYDTDFEEELQLQGNAFQESTLTDEEARQKLKELTDKAREIKKKREEEDEREREKNRVKSGKEMVEAKRIAEELAMKRQVELDKIQKKRDEDYKAQLLEQMRREKEERLGIKIPVDSHSSTVPTKVEPKLTKLEQVEIQCQQVTVGMHAYPDRARTFFETANIYVNNIIKSNGEEKTRRINQSNKAFQERIAGCFGGIETLEVIGFHEDNGFLVMNTFDLGELGRICQILQKYIAHY